MLDEVDIAGFCASMKYENEGQTDRDWTGRTHWTGQTGWTAQTDWTDQTDWTGQT